MRAADDRSSVDAAPVSDAPPALGIERLHAGYDGVPVLEDLSLEVPLGQWLAVLGPNGSGKSTLLYCVVDLLAPTAGEIRLGGHSLATSATAAKRTLGYAPAPEHLPRRLTGRQCLEVHAAAKGRRAIDPDVIGLADSLAVAGRLDRFVDTYSLGTRQKLAILLALIGAPRLIVLDEAFNGLDPASADTVKHHLRSLVSAGRASVVLATHSLDVVERYADRAALLLDGHLVHEWDAAQIASLRRSESGLEAAVADAARRHEMKH